MSVRRNDEESMSMASHDSGANAEGGPLMTPVNTEPHQLIGEVGPLTDSKADDLDIMPGSLKPMEEESDGTPERAASLNLSDVDIIKRVTLNKPVHYGSSISVIKADKYSIQQRRVSRMFPKFVRKAFVDPEIEKLYQLFFRKQKRNDLQTFLLTSALFDIYVLLLYEPDSFPHTLLLRVIISIILTFNIIGLAAVMSHRCSELVWRFLPYLSWILSAGAMLLHCSYTQSYARQSEALGWVVLTDFLIFVTIPIRLRFCLILSGATCIIYLLIMGKVASNAEYLAQQLLANAVLLAGSNLLGLMSYFFMDKKQRKAFLETRQSIEVKIVIEEQSKEQERLLLSVLPEHLAAAMRTDLGTKEYSQFKKIYMSRHENVSILFADIVGFTAISSTYSASELVKILNELFARFDQLAEKFNQLRIKILGDCYYCISGAPEETVDHGIMCVHMGLSMVDAIKYVRESTKSPVDMRVGIHTGAVLAGVLGQRQWQFDVYSKDVILANKMESSGMPGRVHVSNETLKFLKDDFEVEAAQGETREEALKMAGLTTYFIVKVLVPFMEESQRNGDLIASEPPSETGLSRETSMNALPTNDLSKARWHSGRKYRRRLQRELVNRDGHKDLYNCINRFTLHFRDKVSETNFRNDVEAFSGAVALACPLVAGINGIAQLLVLPRDIVSITSFAVSVLFLLILSILSASTSFIESCHLKIVRFGRKLEGRIWTRILWAIILVLLLASFNLVDMVICHNHVRSNCTDPASDDITTMCLYPEYFSYFGVLVLIVVALLVQMGHMLQFLLILLVAGAHAAANLGALKENFDCAEQQLHSYASHTFSVCLSEMLLVMSIALVAFARQIEKTSRVLFVWKKEVEDQKETAADMRQRNEQLVYNILPRHVAKHFIGTKKRKHLELYSHSYEEVGVLFASIPNFSEFYSEESVNNQGLECLRFLNEVISDFDALLEKPDFKEISKIKTIGSTYMAASGLNPLTQSEPDDPLEVRWANLAILVQFALKLKEVLREINEQSFNNFLLKMGINHGPITAGVIGARKPHYDIWGNTVNVASRMESTGKAGYVQVTEETKRVLDHFGYKFDQRGLIFVKGKGQLMTYYLVGKEEPHDPKFSTPSLLGNDVSDHHPEEEAR